MSFSGHRDPCLLWCRRLLVSGVSSVDFFGSVHWDCSKFYEEVDLGKNLSHTAVWIPIKGLDGTYAVTEPWDIDTDTEP